MSAHYICEWAATVGEWCSGRREVESFATYDEAWRRMNEHARAGRSACCGPYAAMYPQRAVSREQQNGGDA